MLVYSQFEYEFAIHLYFQSFLVTITIVIFIISFLLKFYTCFYLFRREYI